MVCPALIDFEASCLPEFGQSFPIEVAIARVDGSSRAWLIKPAQKWAFWDWAPESEALHGISRPLLAREGLPPGQVIGEMAEFVMGCDVYADAELDQYWLEVLCDAVGARLPFPVGHIGDFLSAHGFGRGQVMDALDEAKRRLPREHVAREDARRLALAVHLLLEGRPDI